MQLENIFKNPSGKVIRYVPSLATKKQPLQWMYSLTLSIVLDKITKIDVLEYSCI